MMQQSPACAWGALRAALVLMASLTPRLATADGALAAWGMNDDGQATAAGGDNYIAAVGGAVHSLALRADGVLVGWGNNEYGQLDLPSGTFTKIAAGAFHNVAIRTNGSLAAWGDGFFLQLEGVPTSSDFVSIAAGSLHSLAIRTNGTLAGWGYNDYGQVGPETEENNWLPTLPAGTFSAVAGGAAHSLAIRTDGTLLGWGDNSFGQTTVPSGTFQAVAAGGDHSLGLRTDGSLAAWGDQGEAFALGEGEDLNIVPAGNDFVAIAAGAQHNLALRSNGTIEAWGWNNMLQLNVPTGSYTAIGSGTFHGLAIQPEVVVLPDTGDFTGDGRVDGADFLLWQRSVAATGGDLPADGNHDEVVDGDDLLVWKQQFGSVRAATNPASRPISEPATLALASVLGAFAGGRRFVRTLAHSGESVMA